MLRRKPARESERPGSADSRRSPWPELHLLGASGPTPASPKRQPPPLPFLLVLVHGAHGVSQGPSVQGAEEVISLLLLVSPGSALTLLANLEPPWPFF